MGFLAGYDNYLAVYADLILVDYMAVHTHHIDKLVVAQGRLY